MNDSVNPLQHICYISVPENFHTELDPSFFDPARLLPLELPPGEEEWRLQDLSWEIIIAAMLKILAYQPDHEDGDYYRSFILSVRPDIVNELTEAGIHKAKNSEFELAEEVFSALANLLRDDAPAIINLALIYEQHAEAYEKVGKEDLAEHCIDQAFSAYHRALQVDSESPDIQNYTGQFYFRLGEFEKAETHFRMAAEGSPNSDQKKKAISILDKIHNQQMLDTLFKESYDYICLGKEEEGINKIKQFLELNPNVGNAWFLLGWAFRRLGNYFEARDAFKRAIEIGPPETDALNELAICLMELGDYKNSRIYLGQALRKEPENVKIISNMGILSIKEKKIDEAEGFFLTVLEIDPEDKIARQYLEFLDNR